MRIYALDFDGTSTVNHTHFHPEYHYEVIAAREGMDTKGYKQAILDNIRNREQLKKIILSRSAAGDIFTVATAHSDEKHVRAYFEVLLDGESKKYLPVIHCQPYIQVDGKNASLRYIFSQLQELGHIDASLTLETFGPENITLIDDTISFKGPAEKAGFLFIHADVENNNYLNEIENLIAKDEKGEDLKKKSPHLRHPDPAPSS